MDIKYKQSAQMMPHGQLLEVELGSLDKDLNNAVRIKQVAFFMPRFYQRLYQLVKHIQKKIPPRLHVIVAMMGLLSSSFCHGS